MLESSKRLVVIGLRLRHPNYLKKWWLNVNGKPNILRISNSKLYSSLCLELPLFPFFIFRLSIPRQICNTFKIRGILSGHISSLNQFQFAVKNQCNFFFLEIKSSIPYFETKPSMVCFLIEREFQQLHSSGKLSSLLMVISSGKFTPLSSI